MGEVNEAQYELLDFGNGRKLERVGEILLNRPSPSAESFAPKLSASEWKNADAAFWRSEGLKGRWEWNPSGKRVPERWVLRMSHFMLELKPTEVGHLGIFPEQRANWEWIYTQTRRFLTQRTQFRILNLFAYTGGSTLAAAAAMQDAKISVENRESFFTTHVDSARNIVQWARSNSDLSGFQNVPTRWISEDVMKFAQRELKRERYYDAVILDPPSYGHGAHGEIWKLDQNLPELLELCAELTRGHPAFVLLTAHSPGWNCAALERILRHYFPALRGSEVHGMELQTIGGRGLPSGEAVKLWEE